MQELQIVAAVALLTLVSHLAAGARVKVHSEPGAAVNGSWRSMIDEATWEGWTPPEGFGEKFGTWPDKEVPQEVHAWCKGFIPGGEVIGGYPTIPILGPGGLPIPGLLGKCASTDGRSFSSNFTDVGQRPTDSRFFGWMSVARGRGKGVWADAKCGLSHNVCCNLKGCWDGSEYGQVTCSKACPDDEMQTKKMACWTPEGTANGTAWAEKGEDCQAQDEILAAKVYVKGRGGNPCGEVFGVKPPVASWDVGIVVLPTKRKVMVTGWVDECPSYECYARAKDNGEWGPTITLAQVDMDTSKNIAIALAGYANVPVNQEGVFSDLPGPTDEPRSVGMAN